MYILRNEEITMTEIETKVTEAEKVEFKLLHELHETQAYLETAVRGLHTFLTITETTAVLGLLAYHKSSNIRVNLETGKAKCGLYQSGKVFTLTDGKLVELENAITSYFKS